MSVYLLTIFFYLFVGEGINDRCSVGMGTLYFLWEVEIVMSGYFRKERIAFFAKEQLLYSLRVRLFVQKYTL